MQFSVIIATHNRREVLGRAIRSALRQEPCPEIIVVDDGSTDGTGEHVRTTFPMVLLHRVARGGPGPARNFGLEQARGRWAVILDDDDELGPDALATISRRLSALIARRPRASPRNAMQQDHRKRRSHMLSSPVGGSIVHHDDLGTRLLPQRGANRASQNLAAIMGGDDYAELHDREPQSATPCSRRRNRSGCAAELGSLDPDGAPESH